MFRKVVVGLLAAVAAVSAAALPISNVENRGIFDAQRTITSSRIVTATVEQALAAVQDPTTLIQLSPLVTKVEQDATDPNLYHITDKLSILGINFPTTYDAKFTFLADGVDCDTNASGVHLINQWRVASTPEGTKVTETANLETNIVLVKFVEEQIKTSHGALLEAMATLLAKQSA